MGSCGSLADRTRHLYWVGKGRADTLSLRGRRGDGLHCSSNSHGLGREGP